MQAVELVGRSVQSEIDRLVHRSAIEGDVRDVEDPAAGIGVADRVADIAPAFNDHADGHIVDDEIAQLLAAVGIRQTAGGRIPLLRDRHIDRQRRCVIDNATGIGVCGHRRVRHRAHGDRISTVELRHGCRQSALARIADFVLDGEIGARIAVGGTLHVDIGGVSCRQLVPAAFDWQRCCQWRAAEIQRERLACQIRSVDPDGLQRFVGIAVLRHDREVDMRARIFGAGCLCCQQRFGRWCDFDRHRARRSGQTVAVVLGRHRANGKGNRAVEVGIANHQAGYSNLRGRARPDATGTDATHEMESL